MYPWTGQEMHQLMCDVVYWNSVPRAPFWYMRSSPLHIETHALTHVIRADLPLHAVGENNPFLVQRKLVLNHTILSWLKYLEENPLKMLTMQTIQMVLVFVVAVAAVALVLVKIAAAVIVNKLSIPLICELLYFGSRN